MSHDPKVFSAVELHAYPLVSAGCGGDVARDHLARTDADESALNFAFTQIDFVSQADHDDWSSVWSGASPGRFIRRATFDQRGLARKGLRNPAKATIGAFGRRCSMFF